MSRQILQRSRPKIIKIWRKNVKILKLFAKQFKNFKSFSSYFNNFWREIHEIIDVFAVFDDS